MSSSVLSIHNLPAAEGNSIGAALAEVAIAFKHLSAALLRQALAPVAKSQPQTAFEEAEALRSYAAEIQQQDPGFAQDLFAAADRHEIEASALAGKSQPVDDYNYTELRRVIANPVSATV